MQTVQYLTYTIINAGRARGSGGEESVMPHHTALGLHWKRTCLVSHDQYSNAVINIMYVLPYETHGFIINNQKLLIKWD